MNNRGFTLIELLITIAIIGILSAVAITSYVGVTLKARRSEAYTNLESLRLLQEQRFADSATYAAGGSVAAIQAAGVLPRFLPGGGLNFNYAITNAVGVGLPNPVPVPYAGATAALANPAAPCFIATATGIVGTRVAGDVFAIDCNNNRNF